MNPNPGISTCTATLDGLGSINGTIQSSGSGTCSLSMSVKIDQSVSGGIADIDGSTGTVSSGGSGTCTIDFSITIGPNVLAGDLEDDISVTLDGDTASPTAPVTVLRAPSASFSTASYGGNPGISINFSFTITTFHVTRGMPCLPFPRRSPAPRLS